MASEISRIETGGVSRPIKDEIARNDNLILHQQDNRIYKGRNLVTVLRQRLQNTLMNGRGFVQESKPQTTRVSM